MSIKRVTVQTSDKGFKVEAAPGYQAKQAREQKAADLLALDTTKAPATLPQVFQLLQVVAARQSEIYDMLRQLTQRT